MKFDFELSDSGRVNSGFPLERRDCTVRAAVVRFTTSYARAHELLKAAGREDGRGLARIHVKQFLVAMGLEVKTDFCGTLGAFIKQHQTGRFYVCIKGHALGINNGKIIDTATPRLRKRVHLYA